VDWRIALSRFKELSEKYPDDQLLKVFVGRCSKFISAPPENWEGVWIMSDTSNTK